ncbi:RNA-binding cell elongation regulator Jag/EloR [Helcococcus kunzii]|uniref:RNA-binding cell elongation regulator Jag/EloR n=1 Tax=Helcococcus kunzii TaxID=40091 RepID=UPI0021A8B308|nr:RNA-binding cell elongation regulator Jag/EloR [Helcococcus kunzii]MCT1796847.1 Jag N-terminal domain-containing protein [Helcococcus kunzii]MCT1988405.1 Jag N-terminal domain-containing protein [Helcococcus kunzii]
MKSIIKSAKTIEEAVDLGLKELGLDINNTEIEIIQEPTKGFLGMFGGNDAIVKIKEKDKSTDINLDDIFGDLKQNSSFAEVEDESDEEIDERFSKYDDLEEDEEEIVETESHDTVDEVVENKEDDSYEDSVDSYEDETEEDESDQDFYEKEKSETQTKDFDKSYDEDETTETEQEEYEVFKSDKEKTVNTRELTFSGEAVEINDEDSLEVVAQKTKKILEDILVKMHIETKVDYETNKNNIINLDLSDISENDTGIVIGSKGETLNAIQYTLSLLVNRNTKQFYRVTLNVADYRDRRKRSIENNAKKVAFKVLKTKKSIALKPMNSYERRIVHYALQSYKEIETVSSGKFPNRKVVVKYKG